jgi:putative hydrolase of the HAD superfamily
LGLKGILLDMGSTLLEFENSTWEVLSQRSTEAGYKFLLEKNQKIPIPEKFCDIVKNSFTQARLEVEENLKEYKFEEVILTIFKKMNLSIEDSLYSRFLEVYYKPITVQVTLVDGVKEVLEFFKDKNIPLGIVSNTVFPKKYHLDELERFGILSYFDFELFSSDFGLRKPHPKIFEYALHKLGENPENVVFIGDRLKEDVGGAKEIGMKGVLKYREGRNYSFPILPDAIVYNLVEVKEKISRIFQ